MGWLNGEYAVSPLAHFGEVDGNLLLGDLAERIRAAFVAKGVEVAHFKMSMEADGGLAALQWVRTDSEPEFTQRLECPVEQGRLLLNLRAEAEPEWLTSVVNEAVQAVRLTAELREVAFSAFKPSPPTPTHRVTE